MRFMNLLAILLAIVFASCSGGGGSAGNSTSTNDSSGDANKLYLAGTVDSDNTFYTLLTNGNASEAISVTGTVDASGKVSTINSAFFAGTNAKGEQTLRRIDFGPDKLPVSMFDFSTGATFYFSGYSQDGLVHARVTDANGATLADDLSLNINYEQIAALADISSLPAINARHLALTDINKLSDNEVTAYKAAGHGAAIIFNSITCGLSVGAAVSSGGIATALAVYECGSLIVTITEATCDLGQIKSGLCAGASWVDSGSAIKDIGTCLYAVTQLGHWTPNPAAGESLYECATSVIPEIVQQTHGSGKRAYKFESPFGYNGIREIDIHTCDYPKGPWTGTLLYYDDLSMGELKMLNTGTEEFTTTLRQDSVTRYTSSFDSIYKYTNERESTTSGVALYCSGTAEIPQTNLIELDYNNNSLSWSMHLLGGIVQMTCVVSGGGATVSHTADTMEIPEGDDFVNIQLEDYSCP